MSLDINVLINCLDFLVYVQVTSVDMFFFPSGKIKCYLLLKTEISVSSIKIAENRTKQTEVCCGDCRTSISAFE